VERQCGKNVKNTFRSINNKQNNNKKIYKNIFIIILFIYIYIYMVNKNEIKFREEILKMSNQLKINHPTMTKITKEYLDKMPSKTLHDIAENIHLSIKGYTSKKAGNKTRKNKRKNKRKMTRKMKGGQWDLFLTGVAVIVGVSIILSNMGVALPEPLEGIFGRRPIGNRNPRAETIEQSLRGFADGSSSFRRRRTPFVADEEPSFIEERLRSLASGARNRVEYGDDDCPICLSKLTTPMENGSSNCDHKFHDECIQMWHSSHNNCPICRRER